VPYDVIKLLVFIPVVFVGPSGVRALPLAAGINKGGHRYSKLQKGLSKPTKDSDLRPKSKDSVKSIKHKHIQTHTGQYAAALLLQEQSYKRKQTLAILILKFVKTCYKFLL
jgi:hypothetical protein